MKHLLKKLKIAVFCVFFGVFFTKKFFVFPDLRIKVNKFKESEKTAIFSTSPEVLGEGGGELTNGVNGHLGIGNSFRNTDD